VEQIIIQKKKNTSQVIDEINQEEQEQEQEDGSGRSCTTYRRYDNYGSIIITEGQCVRFSRTCTNESGGTITIEADGTMDSGYTDGEDGRSYSCFFTNNGKITNQGNLNINANLDGGDFINYGTFTNNWVINAQIFTNSSTLTLNGGSYFSINEGCFTNESDGTISDISYLTCDDGYFTNNNSNTDYSVSDCPACGS
jgi:hypothetical protein